MKYFIAILAIFLMFGVCYASTWRVELDTSFNTEADAVAFVNQVEGIKDKVYKPTGNEKIAVRASCRYHECFHADPIPKQCSGYINVDFNDIPKVHKVK